MNLMQGMLWVQCVFAHYVGLGLIDGASKSFGSKYQLPTGITISFLVFVLVLVLSGPDWLSFPAFATGMLLALRPLSRVLDPDEPAGPGMVHQAHRVVIESGLALGGSALVISVCNIGLTSAAYLPASILEPRDLSVALAWLSASMILARDANSLVQGFLGATGLDVYLRNHQKQSGSLLLRGADSLQKTIPILRAAELIGTCERIIVMVIVFFGKYEALGFLFAAKGLIRSKELENREWAEYFILGSLLSLVQAVVVGLCLKTFVDWATRIGG